MHFLSLLKTDVVQAVKILPHGRQGSNYFASSISSIIGGSCPGTARKPGHQQQVGPVRSWYSGFSTRKVNTLRQDGCHFADNTFKSIFLIRMAKPLPEPLLIYCHTHGIKGRYGTYNGNFFHIHSRVVIFGYVMYLWKTSNFSMGHFF